MAPVRRHPARCADLDGSLRALCHVEPAHSGSMAGFPGNFAAAGKYHLLDEDEYWVSFPEFGHCDASKATVKCTVPKP
ncbi:hypothetical protein [Streptomyces sp. WMMB303]|uniref:hypothetical protein n=1 Tax=Streptomyces sp. WMMB303 TaxID=3034154 RepID=UPI0023EA811E|nr:hypothetical protein [Streptomyces sp. WMMB303]MDF4248793.1 hypothetical protein [Streptomyces sp. WMMB303]